MVILAIKVLGYALLHSTYRRSAYGSCLFAASSEEIKHHPKNNSNKYYWQEDWRNNRV
jgi:hypothetical protein